MAHDPASLIEPPARVTLAGNGWGVAAIVGGAVSGLAVGGECYAPHGDPTTKVSSGVFVWFPASEMMMMLFAAEIGAVAGLMMGSYLGEPNRS